MGRYIGPKCRICRSLGYSVCGSANCALLKRSGRPGMHPAGQTRMTDYKKRLTEKQKLRFSYWLSEKQFRGYLEKAMRQPGVAGENLLRLLERRLDNLVYRMGFAPTRLAARQLVGHGHITVNGRKASIPSYSVRPGDTIAVREGSRETATVQEGLERSASRPKIPYLEVDRAAFQGKLISIPQRDEIPADVDENLVVEYYAKYL
ncbi:MAG: 30S ribosomal protein S4 [bacterium]